MIIYLIKSTLLLALLLGLYKLLLENEKMHRFNRYFLLFALIFGLTAPLIQFNVSPETSIVGIKIQQMETVVDAPAEAVSRTVEPLITPRLRPVTSTNEVAETSALSSFFTLRNILLGLYGLITFLLLIRFVSGLLQINKNIISGERKQIDGATMVLLDDKISPQSFFSYIFLNNKDYQSGKIGREILEHELTHVRQWHSLDVLFIETLKLFFWFNPLVYLYKTAIQMNHEFQADDFVVNKVSDVSTYQQLLLKAVGDEINLSTTSKFYHLQSKKRVLMLNKSRTPLKSSLKVLITAPVVLALIFASACEVASDKGTVESAFSNELTIRIPEKGQLFVNDREISLVELDALLSARSTGPERVKLTVNGDAQFGTVTDVQVILKKHNAHRIEYETQQEQQTIDEIK